MGVAVEVDTVNPSGEDSRYEWGAASGGDPVWEKIRETAKKDADAEPLLSSYMYMTVLSHATLEQSISFVLANRLADSTLLPTQLMAGLFYSHTKVKPQLDTASPPTTNS